MTLIFQDSLQVTGGSGTYTLLGYADGSWQYIHTITGATTGEIAVDASLNTIDVDTSLFIVGQTYPFKWVDSVGLESNVVDITIPGLLVLHSIAPDPAGSGGCVVVFDAVLNDGAIALIDADTTIGNSYGFDLPHYPINLFNVQSLIPNEPFVAGHTYYLQHGSIVSNTVTA